MVDSGRKPATGEVATGATAALLAGLGGVLTAYDVKGAPAAFIAAAGGLVVAAGLYWRHQAGSTQHMNPPPRAVLDEVDGRLAAFDRQIDDWERREGYQYAGALHPLNAGWSGAAPAFRDSSVEVLLRGLAAHPKVTAGPVGSATAVVEQIRRLAPTLQGLPLAERPPRAREVHALVAEARRATLAAR